MDGVTDKEAKYEAVKQLIDSFYFTYYILVLSNLYGYLVQPILTYRATNKPVERDITFGLSFLSTCVFYIGSFAPFNISIILFVAVAVTVMLIGEVLLYHYGIVVPSANSISLLANYFSLLMAGVFPLSVTTFWMLYDNKMDIQSVNISQVSLSMRLMAYFLLLLYLPITAIFLYFFRTERFLKRVQSGIWY